MQTIFLVICIILNTLRTSPTHPYNVPEDHAVIPILSELSLPKTQLELIMTKMMTEFEKGLSEEAKDPPENMLMLRSFVGGLPTQQETGSFLTLDFGGTYIRVGIVTLHGHGQFDMDAEKIRIPANLRDTDGDSLFGFVADQIANYVRRHHLETERLSLAFPFSFPKKLESIRSGKILMWAKINAPDVVGKDPVMLMDAALKRRNLDIHTTAMVDDTVSTLVGAAYLNSRTKVGMIVGTGFDAAYIEKSAMIPKLKHYLGAIDEATRDSENHIIHCELASFDNKLEVLSQTAYDKRQDEATTNPGRNVFEKFVSGQYMGEIVRLIIAELWEAGHLGEGPVSEELKTRGAFKTEFMDAVER